MIQTKSIEKKAIKFDFDPDLFTKIYWDFKKTIKRNVIVWGSSGSSKSYSIMQRLVVRSIRERLNILVIRKFATDIHDSVYIGIKTISQDWFDDVPQVKFKYNDASHRIFVSPSRSKFIFKGIDDSDKIKSIFNIQIVFIEEANQLNLSDWMEISRRARGSRNIQFILAFNPISIKHWLKKHFFDTPAIRERTDFIHCKYQDNPFMTDEDILTLVNLQYTDENDYRIYALGEWGLPSEGLVFKPDDWKVVEKIPDKAKKLPYGLDFGFVNDSSALIDIYMINGEWWLDELLYKTGLTNVKSPQKPEQPNIEDEFNELHVDKNRMMVADSAEWKSIQEIRNAGYKKLIGCAKYPGCVMDAIKTLKRYKFNITENSQNLITEFENAQYKVNKDKDDDRKYKDELHDVGLHGIACLRMVALEKGRLW